MTSTPKLPADSPAPVTPLEAELLAARTVSALAKMPPADSAVVLGTVPQDVHEAAALVAGTIRETEPELVPRADVLEQRIERAIAENDDRSRLDDAFKSGAAARAILLEAIKAPDWRQAIRAAVPSLREVFEKANVSAADLQALVQELELLQDLHGGRDLSQVNDPQVRRAVEALNGLDLASLVKQAGADLGLVLFKELVEKAKDEQAV